MAQAIQVDVRANETVTIERALGVFQVIGPRWISSNRIETQSEEARYNIESWRNDMHIPLN